MMGRWSNLPMDLLDLIDGDLILYSDKLRHRVVCASLNFQLSKLPSQQARKLPWLFLQGTNDTEEASYHTIFDPWEKKFYNLHLPEASKTLIKGSAFGWVVAINDVTNTNPSEIYLINLLTRSRIRLPPRFALPDVKDYNPDNVGVEYTLFLVDKNTQTADARIALLLLNKFVLSSSPSSEDCIVIALISMCTPNLAFCKCNANDDKWTPLILPSPYPTSFSDVLFHEHKLYAIHNTGQLLIIENIGLNPKATIVINSPSFFIGHDLAVSSNGDIFAITRFQDFCKDSISYVTCDFELCKANFTSSSWVKVENLGEDIVMFMGMNSIMLLLCNDFPGLKGNSIYFTDSDMSYENCNRKVGSSDSGVFMFDEEMFDDIPGLNCDPKLFWPPPVWLNPA